MAEAVVTTIEILKSVQADGNSITFLTTLPPRELALTQEQIQDTFWRQMDAWVGEHGAEVAGKSVYFDGAILAATMGTVAGGLFYELRASEVFIRDTGQKDPNYPDKKFWTRVLNKNRRPWSIRQGQVVSARVFGHEVSGLVVRAASLGADGGQYQLCGRDNREQVWVARRDVLRFERWLSLYEERDFAEIPHYRRPFDDLAVRNGSRVRFILFGKSCTGRVSALRPASCNIVAEDESRQVAVLVALDNVKEIL